ncbi:MAG: response regulator [Deltaproteobacteria bacterium]|nr:response regulator [Deltaproteobacteria bacterium]
MGLFTKIEKKEIQAPDELSGLKDRFEKGHFPEEVSRTLSKEMERLENTDPSVAEYSIGIHYVGYLLSLPWNRYTEDNLDMARAERVLNEKYYGLKHVKERILDFLAARTLCSIEAFHVLVVEDEEIARNNMEFVLKKAGYAVDTAVNGIKALEKAKEKSYDLILSDLKMEKMDGMQLLETVKKRYPQTEIVLITGYATVSSAVDAMKKGAVHYLTKPINLDELRRIVAHIRDKKKYFQIARGPILCFDGPPGTGKTSIGKAIADTLDRKFIRLSVAGMRDEAELRGHRRTYVGAMAGRIINEIRRVDVRNPIFMLDEIDKIGQDFRGDPASVLLEILDPEQNAHFVDHYLDVPFNLSAAMFIATANAVENLPGPLRDRVEVIHFPGYTEKEKVRIAMDYLIPRQIREHGLSWHSPRFTEEGIVRIIRDYTREAGLRQLERGVAGICRKLARMILSSPKETSLPQIDERTVERFMGPPVYKSEIAGAKNRIGVVTGLVWSEFGGEIVFVEATRMKGTQQLILTGSLGSILKESAQTALSFVRSQAPSFAIDPDFFKDMDIHIHIPAGATPKDGASAGVTIATALISLMTGRCARRDVAMTGEMTLSGRVLRVGGIRQKLHAAQRAGVRRVLLPRRNENDLKDLASEDVEGLEILFIEEAGEAAQFTLE